MVIIKYQSFCDIFYVSKVLLTKYLRNGIYVEIMPPQAIDRIDRKLLGLLLQNARAPLTQLAHACNTSREVIAYRMKRLQQQGIIRGFTAEIDTAALGFVGAAVFLATKAKGEALLRVRIADDPHIAWIGEHAGIWDLGMSLYGRTAGEVEARFLRLHSEFQDTILDYRFTLHKRNHYFYEKLFGMRSPRRRPAGAGCAIDDTDRRLLSLLVADARIDYAQLAREVKLSGPAVAQRIRRLERCGIIIRYTAFVDYSKLSVYQFSIFITSKLEDRARLISFLAEHPAVCYICEYVGEEFLEFGVFVSDPYGLRAILQSIDEAFPENRVKEHSLQREIASMGPPRCVFR
jgi:DNA-binding Lrp family transcriptional regulator